MMPLDRMLAAWDGGRPVGVTASYPFELTTPGGVGKAAGVSWVGVLPSHRRRGILRELMLRQLDDVHERGEPFAILYASESLIYGRFGYGMAVLGTQLDAEPKRVRAAGRSRPARLGAAADRGRGGRAVPADLRAASGTAARDTSAAARAGGVSTASPTPSTGARARDRSTSRCIELDGEPAGYAMYRIASKWEDETPKGEVRVVDAHATSPEATAELWRFLFGIDLVERVKVGSPILRCRCSTWCRTLAG